LPAYSSSGASGPECRRYELAAIGAAEQINDGPGRGLGASPDVRKDFDGVSIMQDATYDLSQRIAARTRELRAGQGLSLDELTQ
jgi:hypothetical protein